MGRFDHYPFEITPPGIVDELLCRWLDEQSRIEQLMLPSEPPPGDYWLNMKLTVLNSPKYKASGVSDIVSGEIVND